MKNSTKIALISAFTAFTMIGAAASTVAWFSTTLGINIDENLTGESNGAYFADGDGSEERPFIINRPVHLYNLAWLQYLGYFNNNTIGAASGPTYFEIDENLEGSLDMDGWYLPPIGTTLNPFVGIFNGNGKTVANLTTINSSSPATYKKSPYPVRQANKVSNVNVLGMFGVVGECELANTGVTSLYPEAGYEGNQISDFYIDNGHVENYQSSTIAGIAAGYVNAPLSGVGISTTDTDTPSSIDLTKASNPTVYGGKTNISDFTSIGYCEDEYKETVLDEYVELYDPSSSQALSGFVAQDTGENAGWGGSIDMKTMYNGLLQSWNRYSNNSTGIPEYPTTRTITYDMDNNLVSDEYGGYTDMANFTVDNVNYKYFQYEQSSDNYVTSSYTFAYRTSSDSYMYLYGDTTNTVSNGLTTTTKGYTDEYGDTISYTNGTTTYYLVANGTTISQTQNAANATPTFYDSTNKAIYYYVNGVQYYINQNNHTTLSTSTSRTTQWNYDSTAGTYSYTYNNQEYYIYCDGTWKIGLDNNATYTISYGANYLTATTTTTGNTNQASSATKFYYDNTYGFYILQDSTRYYLSISCKRNSLISYTYSLVMNQGNPATDGDRPTTNGNTKTFALTSSSTQSGTVTIGHTINRSMYYLRYNSGWVANGTTSQNLTLSKNSSYSLKIERASFTVVVPYTTTSRGNSSYTTKPTYFPLRQEVTNNIPNGIPKETNTGYVISGANDQKGDIRVSKYESSKLDNLSDGSLSKVFTYNDSGTKEITSTMAEGYEKYATSKTSLEEIFKSDTSYIYGLHFVGATVDYGSGKSVYAEKAIVNGDTYYNYELPRDCIDFNLKDKGYINFFAGTYFNSGDNCFFSLHHILRNSDQSIDEIKEIVEVYKPTAETNSYVYKYSNGKYSVPFKFVDGNKVLVSDGVTPYTDDMEANSLPATGYNTTPMFKTSWIKKNTLTQSVAYYFEIPMNSGEYCLSAVSGADGAYLMYLDIGANATKAYRSTVIEMLHTISEEFARPLGVGIVAGSTSIDDANSYCITIKSEYSGVVTIARASATAASYTESVASDLVNLTYAYDSLSINTNEEPSAIKKVEQEIKRITYYDFSTSDSSTTKTVLSQIKTTVDNADTSTTTYEAKQYKKYTAATGGEEVAASSIKIFDDDGFVITASDYAKATFFSDCDELETIKYKFVAEYIGTGTISSNIILTTNQQDTEVYHLYSARGYSVIINLTDSDVTTAVTADCIIFSKDGQTYAVDTTTGTILLVINENFILNDVSTTSS